MMNKAIITRLIAFAVGALCLVIGDYLYGTTYYTDLAAKNTDRFFLSGFLGMAASCLYLYGLFGYADGFKNRNSILRKITIIGLSIFTIGVAMTHSLASAFMFVFNQNILQPDSYDIQKVLSEIDNTYNLYFIPTIIGLILGFTGVLIGIIQNETIFSKKALFFFPFTIAIVIFLLDSQITNYPIILKSPALGGVAFNLALIIFPNCSSD